MKNDYMFKAVLQKNQEVLKALLAVLLHKKVTEITSIKIENPIILGESINEKTVILDIRLVLNNVENINIEMQVVKQSDWEERSLVYTCRNFTTLNKGEPYFNVKPVIHIGILDFRRNDQDTKLYSEYLLRERKSGDIYSDKLCINELSLANLEKATEEEKHNGLYNWAKFFAAKTWEELKMTAEKSKAMQSAIVTMRELTADEKIRLQCEARERYLLDQKSWQAALNASETARKEAEDKALNFEKKNQALEAQSQALYELAMRNPGLTIEEALKSLQK